MLSLGILALRWVSLALMTLMAAITGDLERPLLAGAAIAVTTAWTVWLTVARPRGTAPVLATDLTLAVALTLVSGVVVAQGQVVGSHPFFASAYPVAAAVFWGATAGFRAGLASGAVLGVSLVATQLVNGIDVLEETTPQLLSVASGALNFVLAGGAVGLVAQLLDRSAAELRRAAEETMLAREQAARLSERTPRPPDPRLGAADTGHGARTHFTTAAPKRCAHLSKLLPARMVVWVIGAQAGLVDRKDARVQSSDTVAVALLTKMHPGAPLSCKMNGSRVERDGGGHPLWRVRMRAGVGAFRAKVVWLG